MTTLKTTATTCRSEERLGRLLLVTTFIIPIRCADRVARNNGRPQQAQRMHTRYQASFPFLSPWLPNHSDMLERIPMPSETHATVPVDREMYYLIIDGFSHAILTLPMHRFACSSNCDKQPAICFAWRLSERQRGDVIVRFTGPCPHSLLLILCAKSMR